MDNVSSEEYVNRMINLANKYPNYQCKFIIWYYVETKISTLLTEKNIEHKQYHGINYDSYAEDVYDDCMLLNIDKTELIEFDTWVYKAKHPSDNTTYGISSIENIFRWFVDPVTTSKSFYKLEDTQEILFKNMISTVFPKYEPVTFILENSPTKRKYETITEEGDETIIIEFTVVERRTKKIKI